jgi:hypothetical protein
VAEKLSTVLTDLGGANPLFDRLEAAHQAALLGNEGELDRYDRDVEAHRSKTALRATERKLRTLMEDVKRRLDTTRTDLAASPDEVAHTLNVALELSHQRRLEGVDGQPGLYHVPALSDEWSDTLKDLVDPVTRHRRLLTFDARIAGPAPGPLHAHLNHPLVAHATALLRSQVWSTTTRDELHRVTSRHYHPAAIEGDYDWVGDLAAIAHARVLVTGADGNRLHEQVVARAARYRNGRWAQLDADRHADILWDARLPTAAPAGKELLEQWGRVATDLLDNLTARGQRVAQIKQRDLQSRMDTELKGLEADVDRAADEMRLALARIRDQLDRPQASLFDEEESIQLEADFERLNARYRTIHEKVRAEITHVRSRYETQDVRVFPIAVTFLHPIEEVAGD